MIKDSKAIQQWLDEQRAMIAKDAKKMVSEFWENRNALLDELRETNDSNQAPKPKLGCAVNIPKDGGIRIYWYKYNFVTYTGVKDGVRKQMKRRNNVYIRRPKRGYKYNIKQLQKISHPDEYEIVEMVENFFEKCRKELEVLKKLQLYVDRWDSIQNPNHKKSKQGKKSEQDSEGFSGESHDIDFDKFGSEE